MVEVRGRMDIEGAFARTLGREFAVTYKELLGLLGDPPALENLTPEWWLGVRDRVAGAVRPGLEFAFGEAIDSFADEVGFTFDWDLKNQAAIDWAIGYTAELGDGLVATRRKKISAAVADFFERDGNMGKLRKDIGRWVSPESAALIASTEVTRAAVGGELWAAADLKRQGVNLRTIWQTNNDSLVCPLCGPLNGTPEGVDWWRPPPLHTGCRCWINHEVVVDGKALVPAAFKAAYKIIRLDEERLGVVPRAA